MITLKNNQLHFTFAEISSELRRLADPGIARLTAQFLAEDRNAALQYVLKHDYLGYDIDAAYILEATNALLEITPDKIAVAIHRHLARDGVLGFGEKLEPVAAVSFQRTLRIPDDGKSYPLPPGLGVFPLAHVDDHEQNVPPAWSKRGGVMMPMYQAEALWLHFHTHYPCAIKVAAGKINAVSGEPWSAGLNKSPQDYLVLPGQPWLDGYCVAKCLIRQFVAMPLGQGYSAEEQITGNAEHGGLQLQVYPLRASLYFEEDVRAKFPRHLVDILSLLLPVPRREMTSSRMILNAAPAACYSLGDAAMDLGAGGMMHQDIYEDERPLADYDLTLTSRCFVHLCNSASWKVITGLLPPACPVTAQTYARYKLPWFDSYRDDLGTVDGAPQLANLKTVAQLHQGIEKTPLPDNQTVAPKKLIQFGAKRRPHEVLEWTDDEPSRS